MIDGLPQMTKWQFSRQVVKTEGGDAPSVRSVKKIDSP